MDNKKAKEEEKAEKKLPVGVGILIAVLLLAIFGIVFVYGKQIGEAVLTGFGISSEKKDNGPNSADEITPPTQSADITKPDTPTNEPTVEPTPEEIENVETTEDEVFNLLIIGLDQEKENQNADTIIVANMNITDGTYHMLQLMGDLYVEIPGFGQGCLKQAYQYGGGKLLIETITENFGFQIAGYISASYDSFVHVVDLLGGITMNVSKAESDYLNSTNYISNISDRNLVEGTQKLNGNQTVGYCRIPFNVNTDSELDGDFSRVNRAKEVVTKLFDKISSKSLNDLISLMNSTLPQLRTSLTKAKFQEMLETMTEIGMQNFESIRIPIDNLYSRAQVNERNVYIPNWSETNKVIYDFVYGKETDATE